MAASAELLRHVALRRAISEQATDMMDEAEFTAGWNSDLGQQTVSKSEPMTAEHLEGVRRHYLAATNQDPALSDAAVESKPAWVVKSMSTKESIWTQIQDAAAKDPATNGMGITAEQAQAKFLGTPAGNKLYEAWTKAPWDAGGSVRKSEDAGAPRGTSHVRRSAADQATLDQMGIDALAGK